jgi:hypothetical protein
MSIFSGGFMNKAMELKYQIESLREKLLSLLTQDDNLHSPELIALSEELHNALNEYHRLIGIGK